MRGEPVCVVGHTIDADAIVRVAREAIERWDLPVSVERKDNAEDFGVQFTPQKRTEDMTDEQLQSLLASSGEVSLPDLRELSNLQLQQLLEDRLG